MYSSEPSYPWMALRTAVIADDSAIATFDYDSWPAENTFNIPANFPEARKLAIAFYGTDAADEALTKYNLYGRLHMNGPIILLASGVVTLGAKLTTKNPITKVVETSYWADTITATTGFLSTASAPGVFINDTGADGICVLNFDRAGLVDLYCEMDLNTCASISAIITGR